MVLFIFWSIVVKRRTSGIGTGSKATAIAKDKDMVHYTSETLQNSSYEDVTRETLQNVAYEDVTRRQEIIYEDPK